MKAGQPVWDRWGRWAALACLVHCAATPLLVLTDSALLLVPPVATATKVEPACDGCCPTLATDAAGTTRLKFPPASILTIAGSCLLLGVHRRRQPQAETCCPPPTDAATCSAAPTLSASGTAR